ncbi:MAG: 50S ribosomal protein L28 [Holosporales bacterium]|nr:50S ribosomal protein L28 [Holosporales bacterium]
MARRCEVCGKGVLTGNNVSHAHNKTRCRFLPNMHKVSLISDALARRVRLRVSVSGVRTIEQNGGLDAFLLSSSDKKLGPGLLSLKKTIVKKLAKNG